MSLKAWKWASALVAVLLLSIPAGYTWLVLSEAPKESWAWWHQLVATFFSVAFASAVAVWLYAWQTGKTDADRKTELRAAQFASIFDTWALLDDANLQTVELPDGSEAEVLLTFLQPLIYEESVRTGLFGASETMTMSRLSAVMHLYNGSVQRLLPLLKLIESADGEGAEGLRDEIDAALANREKVVEASKNLINLWTLTEVRAALAVANPGEREKPDPRVAQIIEESLPKISPPSYKAGISAKLDKAKEAAEAGDTDAARRFIDEVIEEAEALRDKKITPKSADQLISAAEEFRRTLQDL